MENPLFKYSPPLLSKLFEPIKKRATKEDPNAEGHCSSCPFKNDCPTYQDSLIPKALD